MNFSFDLMDILAEEPHTYSKKVNYESNQIEDLQSNHLLEYYFDEEDQFSFHQNVEELVAQEIIAQQQPAKIMQARPTRGQNPIRNVFESMKKPPSTVKAPRRKRKILKASPFHNFQKHLIATLKQVISVPEYSLSDEVYVLISRKLWSSFKENPHTTKKYLHFIFNERNQIPISQSQLITLGLIDLYNKFSHDDLNDAKNFLTHLAIEQLEDQKIDFYMKARRIRNKEQFKKYLVIFRKELQDGFIKKRFTNKTYQI